MKRTFPLSLAVALAAIFLASPSEGQQWQHSNRHFCRSSKETGNIGCSVTDWGTVSIKLTNKGSRRVELTLNEYHGLCGVDGSFIVRHSRKITLDPGTSRDVFALAGDGNAKCRELVVAMCHEIGGSWVHCSDRILAQTDLWKGNRQ